MLEDFFISLQPGELWLIGMILLLDALMGDPRVNWHPVVLLGNSLAFIEKKLFSLGLNGTVGGCLLLLTLLVLWLLPWILVDCGLRRIHPWLSVTWQVLWGAFLIAVRSLISHGMTIARACEGGDLEVARKATGMLVGRDTRVMNMDACRRAAVESLAESLVDGIITPIFFYFICGVPGILIFKIISTMDSMVGYKNERYLHFGWCGARIDDLCNWMPARLTWLIMTVISLFWSGMRAGGALRAGWKYHNLVPGPNSGWPEATMAGALGIRLVGPIWKQGVLVTELWLGDPLDPAICEFEHVKKAARLVVLSTIVFCLLMGVVRMAIIFAIPAIIH